ncbi:alpha/beta fold hydrolase [Sutcliffiella rhizosphaerae]|uniref:Dihydrolipoyllysine-residue acetyltransferase component of acetoin cleaving system n=1 Tax=Sutcliffiella rhizosphaerae TaxID=2880967 RepID=A0ABM8YPM4_9BACI|nr:alpha/beta hydrolase [Sutcliffiella rhizosphaerae]CAG9621978.1 Dihydrolipoyllysine-residue acetyltransferase component of acetoin cleaving system [Sutcliffiella rhizosphaerae]
MAGYEKVVTNSISLYYEDRGIGLPIVLLHGFCGSNEYWKYCLEELSEKNRVIAIDLRGHGHSAVAEDEFTVDEMADDVKKLLDSLEIERSVVLGHSLGGYVALALAENEPNLIAGLGLIHSTPYADSEESKIGREKGIIQINNQGINEFVTDLVPKLFSPENLESHKGEVEFTKKLGYQTTPQGAIGTLQAMKNRIDRSSFIKNYQGPLLLVAGKEDRVIPQEKTFITDGDHVKKVLLEHSGHMGMLEEPRRFVEEIKTFIDRVDS